MTLSSFPKWSRYSPSPKEHIYCFYICEAFSNQNWDVLKFENSVFYTGVLTVPRFTAAFTPTFSSPGAAVAAPTLSWSGILSLQREAIHWSCVQVASRPCCPNLCNMQNNLGCCNIPSMCAHGKMALWKLRSGSSQDHKTRQRRLKEYCKEYGNILVWDEALPQTVVFTSTSSALEPPAKKKHLLIF